MKIVLSGIETFNKGAELMLYAIIQEIERRYPNALIYVPVLSLHAGTKYLHTQMHIRTISNRLFLKVLRKFGLKRLFDYCSLKIVNKADYFLDASGFLFSDDLNLSDRDVRNWKRQLSNYHKMGTKIVFLPQAFGPINKEHTKQVISLIDKHADLLFARERVSYDYLRNTITNSSILKIAPDFTLPVKGIIPQKYIHLRNCVCIIPNYRIVQKKMLSYNDYINYLVAIIQYTQSRGENVFILNHESILDERIAFDCQKKLKGVEVVTGCNALEVKGIISSSLLCISGRFHGVVSCLNSAVPCLSTSWSHKYEELFSDYGQKNCILSLKDLQLCFKMIDFYLDKSNNSNVKNELRNIIPQKMQMIKNMWDSTFNLKK